MIHLVQFLFFGDPEHYWQKSAKAVAMMYFFLQGTPFIYQGQEIGMTNMPFTAIEQIDAVDSRRLYNQLLEEGKSPEEAIDIVADTTRDNSRTPMQWGSEKYAGFSTNEPWLMVNPNYHTLNVEEQENDPSSILSFYKQMIRIRRENQGLIYGSFKEYLAEHDQLYVYERSFTDKNYLIIVNLTSEVAEYSLPNEVDVPWELLLTNQEERVFERVGKLDPYEAKLFVTSKKELKKFVLSFLMKSKANFFDILYEVG